ncbi:VWA domain-containing protein [Candidatus Woesebacteria bacterium]|nr:VWA domain-containing protein [Candidatus Woesebacteria bacterium]
MTDLKNFFSKFKTNKKLKYILIFYCVIIVSFLFYKALNADFNFNLGKIDDWQFTPDVTSSLYDLDIGKFMRNLSVVQFFVLIVLHFLYALIPINIFYLNYRFFGFIVRRFRKELKFGSRKNVGRSILLLILGILSAGATVYLSIQSNWILPPVLGAAVIVLALTLIYIIVSSILLIVRTLNIIYRKLANKSLFGMKRKWLWNFSSVVSVLLILVWVGLNIWEIFFGIDLFSATNITPVGGGLTSMSAPSFGSSTGTFNLSPDSALMPSGGGGFSGRTSDNIGFSTGGAKDINNFRENIKNKYLPLFTDVTYEGLFYDYYFDTGQQEECAELFCPSYSYAQSADPLSGEPQYFLSVGLNSGIKQSDFQRKKLNLVIVMDISGSMSSSFNRYYYDRKTNEYDAEEESKSKMQVANESVVALLDHLNPQDRYGMVLFDGSAYLAKPLRLLDTTDLESIKGHILEISPQGSTNMEAGYKLGTEVIEEYLDIDPEEYENRIIFLTDAQPNTGVLSEEGLVGLSLNNADRGIYTTFIGIGVDFNTELIEAMTKIKGANYYSIHSASDFKYRMDEGFDYMVTPLVFDLVLKLDSPGFTIDKVYGSPEANLATGEIMRVNTLFPSDSTSEGVKGGIVLLKLSKNTDSAEEVSLEVSYEDRLGQLHNNEKKANITVMDSDYYPNTGVRKAILLTRYANLLKNWIQDQRSISQQNTTYTEPCVSSESGIIIPVERELSRWERTSVPLKVMPEYRDFFFTFNNYFVQEMQYLQDQDLEREVQVFDLLINN